MSSWEYTNFRPKWALDADDRKLLSEMPDVGDMPALVPSVATRLLPTRGGSGISAATLSDAILSKQRILNYASYEVVRGIDPSFSDLRRIDEQCLQLGKLDFEPFEEGSFVIPAELKAEPLSIKTDEGVREFTTANVVERFNQVISGLPGMGIDFPVSMGLISEITELSKLLKRDVGSLEFLTELSLDMGERRRSVRHRIDQEYIKAVEQIRESRQQVLIRSGDTLVGILVAVDFEKGKLKVRLDSEGQHTIPGTFSSFLTNALASSLMKKAQFHGKIKYVSGIPTHITLVKLVPTQE